MGSAMPSMLKASGVGVTTAAKTKIATTAHRHAPTHVRARTTPARFSATITTGSRNARPNARISRITKAM